MDFHATSECDTLADCSHRLMTDTKSVTGKKIGATGGEYFRSPFDLEF